MLTIHVVPNAHIDPAWLWDWREGMNEGIATCRAMVDLMEANADLTFTRNEAFIYEHIERNDPELFARIRRLIEAGRWEIIGGARLQPDTNLGGGERTSGNTLRATLLHRTVRHRARDRLSGRFVRSRGGAAGDLSRRGLPLRGALPPEPGRDADAVAAVPLAIARRHGSAHGQPRRLSPGARQHRPELDTGQVLRGPARRSHAGASAARPERLGAADRHGRPRRRAEPRIARGVRARWRARRRAAC